MASTKLSQKELKDLQSYLDEMDKLEASEPPHLEETLSPEEYERVSDYLLNGKGNKPESADYFTVTDITVTDRDGVERTHKGIYDTAWEKWNKKCNTLNDKYHDLLLKAISIWMTQNENEGNTHTTTDIVRSFVAGTGSKKDLRTQLKNLVQYSFMTEKASRRLISADPITDNNIDGQLRMFWNTNEAGENKPEVNVLMALTYEGNDVYINKELTLFDEQVLTACCNLIWLQMECGFSSPYCFTVDQIWRTMNGITESRKSPSENQKKKICDSLDKMRFTNLFMDVTNEIKANFLDAGNDWMSGRLMEGIADENYIYSKKRIITLKNKTQTYEYAFFEMPFIFAHALAKNQVVLINSELLNTREIVRTQDDSVDGFKMYLLREIACMYSKYRESNRILFSTLYKDTRIPSPDDSVDRDKCQNAASYRTKVKKKAKKDRDKISSLLDYWTKQNWINGYTWVKEKQKIIGVDINLIEKNFYTPRKNSLLDNPKK